MSVLIKGMEIPTNCHWCPLLVSIDGADDHVPFCYCALDHFKEPCTPEFVMTRKETMEKRHEHCPLVPIPPHGDLIDRYDLKNKEITIDYDEWDDTFDDGLLFVADLIDSAPTVIPTDESDMDSFIHIFEEDDEEDGMDSFIRILKD